MKCPFEHCSDAYARHRPPYPAGLFDELRRWYPPGGAAVADIGAGTGIFTAALVQRGWRVVAIEPSRAMAAHINPPAARVRAAAEAVPLADASIGMITAAQAFHWFNPPVALRAFSRVLRPGGVLALVWNNRDAQASAFVQAFEVLIQEYNASYECEYRVQDWAAKIAAAGTFAPAVCRHFNHLWRMPHEDFIGFCRSVSYIRNVLSRAEMPRFEARARALLSEHFGHRPCAIPLRTDVWITRRQGAEVQP